MTKWAHKVITDRGFDPPKLAIRQLGEAGWELVSVQTSGEGYGLTWHCFFKRPEGQGDDEE